MGDKFSDVGNAIRDFLAGIGDSLVGTVKGLLTLVVDLGLLYVHSECSRMTLGHVPETLDQEVEKIKQKYEPLFKDPVNTIGGIGQSICDTADEKGVAYSSGYIVTEVVTALLADKGLDKRKILHDDILNELGINQQMEYSWGKISSDYDARSNVSSIDIMYF